MSPLKRDFLDIYLTTCSESVISGLPNLCGSSFFSKCSKFRLEYKNAEKNWENDFYFWDNCISSVIVKLSLLRSGYLSLASNLLTSSRKIWHANKRLFPTQLPWQWSIMMIKVLWCWFQQCLGPFTMLLVQGCFETRLFRHLSNHVFGVRNFGYAKSMRIMFFFQNLQRFI